MELVLQGPLYEDTEEIIQNYLKLKWVTRIILSGWVNDRELRLKDSRITELRVEDVENPSILNVNRQIYSSQRGLDLVTSDYCAKMRTDQFISVSVMEMLNRFYNKFKANEISYSDGSGPVSPIFVLGMYTRFPFHPRDHVFWGIKSDLVRLFDIPYYAQEPQNPPDFTKVLRPEAYIGMHYYAKFDPKIYKYIEDPTTYLVDDAPKLIEALETYNRIRDKVFKVFPRTELRWMKHGLKKYHFDVGIQHSEYWHDAPWERKWFPPWLR